MEYMEHIILLFVFLMAVRYLQQVLFPGNKSGACSKSCGNNCAVEHLEKAMTQFDNDLKKEA